MHYQSYEVRENFGVLERDIIVYKRSGYVVSDIGIYLSINKISWLLMRDIKLTLFAKILDPVV
jgi:hypothetical protein